MDKLIILLAISIGGAACTALPDAQTRTDRAQDALIAEHKLINADSEAARAQAAIDYYASEQYRQARHANQFIAKHRGDL